MPDIPSVFPTRLPLLVTFPSKLKLDAKNHLSKNTTVQGVKLTNLDKIRDRASSMVNHTESTIERQRRAVFPVHFAGGS